MNKDFTNAAVPRLKDQPEFIAYAQANQWATRRERGWAWQTNVFDFIATTYKDYLGKGLLQSDFRACDPDLYARLHKELTSMPPESSTAKIKELNLPKERSDDALKMLVTDPIERAEISAVRRHERVRSQKYRDGVKNRDQENIDQNFQNVANADKFEETGPILRIKELFDELSAIYTAASASEKAAFEQHLKELNKNVSQPSYPLWDERPNRRGTNPAQWIMKHHSDLVGTQGARAAIGLRDPSLIQHYSSWIRPNRHPEDNLHLDTRERRDLSDMRAEEVLQYVRKQKREATQRSRAAQKTNPRLDNN